MSSAPKQVMKLFREINRELVHAFNNDKLQSPRADIEKYVVLEPAGRSITEVHSDAWAILGGTKDFDRHPSSARLIRDDGAWIHFSLAIRESAKEVQIIAYDFEVVFDREPVRLYPRFVRIDLNLKGHQNDSREKRCHLHPGHDHVQVPWDEQKPVEVLRYMLNDLRSLKQE